MLNRYYNSTYRGYVMRKYFISLFVAFVVFAYPLTALAEAAAVTVRVDGLSCPALSLAGIPGAPL